MRDKYYKAYKREKEARQQAESFLEEKSQQLYENRQELLSLNAKLMGHNRGLIQAEKLAALGRLSSGVAHEIKNPLAYIKSNMELLQENFNQLLFLNQKIHDQLSESMKEDYPEIRGALEKFNEYFDLSKTEEFDELFLEISKGLSNIESISSTLRDYNHSEKNNATLIDINAVINDALRMVKRKNSPVEVMVNLNSIPMIHGVEGEMSQIMINFISNAIDASKASDTPKVGVKTELHDGLIQIVIQDNGIGISSSDRDKIFDPFFTTKPIGEGTGLGLYISYNLVKKFKGQIDLNTQKGKGTIFTISLPLNN